MRTETATPRSIPVRRLAWTPLLGALAAACAPIGAPSTTDGEPSGTSEPAEVVIDPDQAPRLRWASLTPVPCLQAPTPALDASAHDLGLDRAAFAITDDALAESSAQRDGLLDDGLTLSVIDDVRGDVRRAACVVARADRLDVALDPQQGVAHAIREAASLLESPVDDVGPFDPSALPGGFRAAVDALCALDDAECETPDVSPEADRALAALVWALRDGVIARRQRDTLHEATPHDAAWWTRHGGKVLLHSTDGEGYNPLFAPDRAYLFASRAELYNAAARIAHTVQNTSWQELASATQVDIDTPFGGIRVRGSGDDLHDEKKAFLLHVDLGGDDTYLSEIASNLTGDNPVSVAVDVEGDDLYSYREAMTSTRTDLLPADVDGRFSGSDRHGAVTLSSRGRQGSARNGIAMLFDLAGDDRYRTLRMGQGYAHHGVGVLFDGGGHDSYVAEAAAQGSAQLGIGLLIDAGEGNDTMRAFTMAQGFGFAGAIGAVVDGGGDDRYDCDRGAPETGGRPLYLFPGLEDRANTSFCQGAGFGRRSTNPRDALSGGLGILRDRGGDDTYVASVYAQGAGYWQATGVLSDGGGDDTYDGVYYVQGAGVHFANGILADADGDDRYGMTFEIEKLSQGAGHDFGVGVLIDERGHDAYRVPGFGAGGSSCNGLGLFIDNAGDDHYTSRTLHSTGVGNAGSCGTRRPTAISAGIMIDAGGIDRYDYPTSPTLVSPGEGLTWGHTLHELVSEHGAGRDTEMDSGVHLGR